MLCGGAGSSGRGEAAKAQGRSGRRGPGVGHSKANGLKAIAPSLGAQPDGASQRVMMEAASAVARAGAEFDAVSAPLRAAVEVLSEVKVPALARNRVPAVPGRGRRHRGRDIAPMGDRSIRGEIGQEVVAQPAAGAGRSSPVRTRKGRGRERAVRRRVERRIALPDAGARRAAGLRGAVRRGRRALDLGGGCGSAAGPAICAAIPQRAIPIQRVEGELCGEWHDGQLRLCREDEPCGGRCCDLTEPDDARAAAAEGPTHRPGRTGAGEDAGGQGPNRAVHGRYRTAQGVADEEGGV